MVMMMSIQELDKTVADALDDILRAISDAGGDGTLPDNLPERYLRIRSYASSAVHGFRAAAAPPTADDVCAHIDRLRDAKIDGGFVWNENRYQSRPSDRENIMGAAQLAMAFIGAGGDAQSLRWVDPDNDFVWITADNAIVPMSPADVIDMFQTGVAFKSALTFYARSLKDAVLDAEDPTAIDINSGWPA